MRKGFTYIKKGVNYKTNMQKQFLMYDFAPEPTKFRAAALLIVLWRSSLGCEVSYRGVT
jgi:hypothetical protein